MQRFLAAIPIALALAILPGTASAEETLPNGPRPVDASFSNGPKIGGHLGLGLTLFTVANGSGNSSIIFGDFFTIAPVAGVNFAVTKKWSFDLEFIVLSQWRSTDKATPGTQFLFDPGVVYDADWAKLGLRMAARVPGGAGTAELGVIPIIIKVFDFGAPVKYYVEFDLPIFFYGQTPPFAKDGPNVSLTGFVQTGVAF